MAHALGVTGIHGAILVGISNLEDVNMTKIVTLDINDIIRHDLEGFLELLEQSCEGKVLEDISYQVVGAKNGLIMVEVTANEMDL